MTKRAVLYFVLACAAVLPYLPFLSLPLISDTYTQIFLARLYGDPQGWGDLAADPLYRCRATSLVFTFLVDTLFGADSTAHKLANFFVHAANVWLIFALGRWTWIGQRVALKAAVFFALYEGHQEAVVWVASLPELLMFFFSLLTLHAWIRWSDGGFTGWRAPVFATLGFVLALLSKESAVAIVPVLAWIVWREHGKVRAWAMVSALGGLAAAYALLIFAASASHLHLNDGTFSAAAPFWFTLPNTISRMLWFWGLLGLGVVVALGRWRGSLEFPAVWVVCTLLPYSFLAYMNRVPSRHTYFAAAGLAILIGTAFVALRDRWQRAPWLAPALALIVAVHNCGYLWIKKLPQYQERAGATERFLEYAKDRSGTIGVRCRGPYGIDVYRHAAAVMLARAADSVNEDPDSEGFCEETHP